MQERVLVTGAGRGIGRAIAVGLAREGRRIYVNCCHKPDEAEETCQLVRAKGGGAAPLLFDVANREDSAEALRPFARRRMALSMVIHNAGIRRDGLFCMMRARDWEDVIQTNLGSVFHVLKPVLRGMLQLPWGRIVFLSSVAGLKGVPGQVNYAAAKAGLIGAAKSLAVELALRAITVNVVAPGLVDTSMLEGLPAEELARRVPMRRIGTPDEIASTVRFLCSREANFITGQVVSPNGGEYR